MGAYRFNNGFLSRTRALFQKNRLGELLVHHGVLSPQQLRFALARQKTEGGSLGRVLVRERMVSRALVQSILAQQFLLRFLAGITALIIAMTCVIRPAKAGPIEDVPARISIAAQANAAFMPLEATPALFGAEERRSGNLDPFTKWTGMFRRFDAAIGTGEGQKMVATWQSAIRPFAALDIEDMAEKVNDYVNAVEYIEDSNNYGNSDYWATPFEFFRRGGDCEDYAIAKYVSLRALGVPEERMRIVILQDLQKNIPHAVLAVFTGGDKAMILDNQNKRMLSSASISHYKPIFSINRTGWWLHSKPKGTVLASAE